MKMLVTQLALLCLKFSKKDWNVRNLISCLGALPKIPIDCDIPFTGRAITKKGYALSPDDPKHQNVNDARGWYQLYYYWIYIFLLFKIIYTFILWFSSFQFCIFWKQIMCLNRLYFRSASGKLQIRTYTVLMLQTPLLIFDTSAWPHVAYEFWIISAFVNCNLQVQVNVLHFLFQSLRALTGIPLSRMLESLWSLRNSLPRFSITVRTVASLPARSFSIDV